MRDSKKRLAVVLCTLAPLAAFCASVANAGTASDDHDRALVAADPTGLSGRMDRLEARLQELEGQVAQLRSEKQRVQENLEREKQETTTLRARLAQPAAVASSDHPREARIADDEQARSATVSEWGTRVGYQGFPFGQREGGFFYSFFFGHRLFDEAEGIPFGDLDTEIAVGIGRSGSDHLTGFSEVLLQKVNFEYRQTILSGLLGMKYYFNHWAPMGLRPYVAGGPGIWGDVIESPPYFIGQTSASGELAKRKTPVNAGASIFEGGQGGAGLEYSLARTRIPILERLNIGFDYRYTAWTTGQRFSSYGFSLFVTD